LKIFKALVPYEYLLADWSRAPVFSRK